LDVDTPEDTGAELGHSRGGQQSDTRSTKRPVDDKSSIGLSSGNPMFGVAEI
jgi:hypothetical protein